MNTASHPLIRFENSVIHGQGGFATGPIAKEALIIEYVGRKIDKVESLKECENENPFIFTLDDQFDLDGNVDWNPARLLNHSCEPNAEAQEIDGHIWIVASRDIVANEEITFNYNYDLEDYTDHVCLCGAKTCVGYMVAEELFPELQAKLQRAKEAEELPQTTIEPSEKN
jgi:SET domain-containing protein